MFIQIGGVVRFKIIAPDKEAVINAIRSVGASCWGISAYKGIVYASTYLKNLRKFRRMAEGFGGELEVISESGAIFRLLKYRKRFGIAAGIIIFFAFIVYFSNIITTIEIYGGESISHDEILSVLGDYGIKRGAFLPALDFKTAEQSMIINIDRLAWISVRNTGGRVTVEYTELEDSPKIEPRWVPSNVVAAKSAQIVDVKVYSGELSVMLGDGVSEGQLLISGVLTNKDGTARYVHSLGEIIGRYHESVTIEQQYSELLEIPTGESVTKRYLSFFGLRIPISVGGVDGDYRYSESTSYFRLFGAEIPIGIIYCRYDMIEERELHYTEDEAYAEIEARLAEYEKNFFLGHEIIERNYTDFSTDEKKVIRADYTLEGDIGRQSLIIVDKFGDN